MDLFDASDADEIDDSVSIKRELGINNGYAKSYEQWRRKEELEKFKSRYGEEALNQSHDSSEDSEDERGEEVTDTVEQGFLKALSALKSSDPKIYESTAQFYDAVDVDSVARSKRLNVSQTQAKVKKEERLFLQDYERKLVTEKGGELSEDDDNDEILHRSVNESSTYVDRQKQLKDSFANAAESIDKDDSLLSRRTKTVAESGKEDADYRQWLKGRETNLTDDHLKKDLKGLHDFWNSSNLPDDEKFLRDYILNHRYKEEGDDDDYNEIPTYDDIVSDKPTTSRFELEEDQLKKEEMFEHKYNFRYEEPDANFIKNYPRTVGTSLRRTDDKRKLDRERYKERKAYEKQQMQEEIKQMKNAKLKELQEKLDKLKEITGNAQLGLSVQDLDGDFDPDEYDKKMKDAFSDNYYQNDETEKPVFSDSEPDDDWDHWKPPVQDDSIDQSAEQQQPSSSTPVDLKKELIEHFIEDQAGSSKRKKRSNPLALALKRKKPKFDPNEKSFKEFFDEYYKLDYEDIIGDTVCRFKYRTVLPNDYGLNTDEMLYAKDKELNSWVSLKRITRFQEHHDEMHDAESFKRKANDFMKKQKVLPSFYSAERVQKQDVKSIESGAGIVNSKKKKKLKKQSQVSSMSTVDSELNCAQKEISNDPATKKKKRNRKRKSPGDNAVNNPNSAIQTNTPLNKDDKKKAKEMSTSAAVIMKMSDDRLAAYGMNPKKLKNKAKYSKRFNQS